MNPKKTEEEKDSALIQAILEGLTLAGIPAFRGEVFRDSIMVTLPGDHRATLIEVNDRRVHFPSNYCKWAQVTARSGMAKTYSKKRVQLIVATAIARYGTILQAYQA